MLRLLGLPQKSIITRAKVIHVSHFCQCQMQRIHGFESLLYQSVGKCSDIVSDMENLFHPLKDKLRMFSTRTHLQLICFVDQRVRRYNL